MATDLDLARVPALPPVGGDTFGAQLEMESKGWSVINGKVHIPESPANNNLYKNLASLLGAYGGRFLNDLADGINSAYVANEYTEFTSRWNNLQQDIGSIYDEAHNNASYDNLPQQIEDTWKKFQEDYIKERGDYGAMVVSDQFRKGQEYLAAETMRQTTQGAKAVAAEKLLALKVDKLTKVHGDPTQAPFIIDSLNPALFQVGNATAEDAYKDYERTVKNLVQDAVFMQGASDPTSAMDLLEQLKGYIRPKEYISYRKQLGVLARQRDNMDAKAMAKMESIERIKALANSEEVVELTPQLKKDADIFEANWNTLRDEDTEYNKNMIYAKIGYVPGQYATRLRNEIIRGGEGRAEAAASVIYLSSNLPPWNGDLPEETVGLAYAYSELSQIGVVPQEDLAARYDKYVNYTSEEREAIYKKAAAENNAEYKHDVTYYDKAHNDLFPKDSWWPFGEGKEDPEAWATAMPAIDQYKFKKEFYDKTALYMGLGLSYPAAYSMAIHRLEQSWGISHGIGGDGYPAHAPIEKTLGIEDAKSMKRMRAVLKGMISAEPRAMSTPFPKDPSQIRVVYDSGEGTDAIYGILEYSPEHDIWLPYLVADKERGARQLFISAADVRKSMGLEDVVEPQDGQ